MAARLRETAEGQRGLVVAGGNAALILEVPGHVLDAVPVLVSKEVTGDQFAPVDLWQDDRQNTAH